MVSWFGWSQRLKSSRWAGAICVGRLVVPVVILGIGVVGCGGGWNEKDRARFERSMEALKGSKEENAAELERIIEWLRENAPGGGSWSEHELWVEELARKKLKGQADSTLESLINKTVEAFSECDTKRFKKFLELLKELAEDITEKIPSKKSIDAVTETIERLGGRLDFRGAPTGGLEWTAAAARIDVDLVAPGGPERVTFTPQATMGASVEGDTLTIDRLGIEFGELGGSGTSLRVQSTSEPLSGDLIPDDSVFRGGWCARVEGLVEFAFDDPLFEGGRMTVARAIEWPVYLSADTESIRFQSAVVDVDELFPRPTLPDDMHWGFTFCTPLIAGEEALIQFTNGEPGARFEVWEAPTLARDRRTFRGVERWFLPEGSAELLTTGVLNSVGEMVVRVVLPLSSAGEDRCYQARIMRGGEWLATPAIVQEVTHRFIRGDIDQDGELGIDDAIALGERLDDLDFDCIDAADANDDGEVTVEDVAALLEAVVDFAPIPGPAACGVDPTPDFTTADGELGCLESTYCD